jgi:hypothetical protein
MDSVSFEPKDTIITFNVTNAKGKYFIFLVDVSLDVA